MILVKTSEYTGEVPDSGFTFTHTGYLAKPNDLLVVFEPGDEVFEEVIGVVITRPDKSVFLTDMGLGRDDLREIAGLLDGLNGKSADAGN